MENSVPRLKLGDVLAVYEPIHVLGTTFTLSLAFFESSVWPRIKTNRLSNFLIISDRIGLSRAYQEAPALKLAGREYVATAAPTRRTFHPKVWLLIEERRALLLVGSGNLTQAGFMENLELFEAIEMGPEIKCSAKLREDVQEFLKGLRSLWPVQDLSDELPALRALDQILKAFADLPSEISESKECKRRLFHSFQGKFTELLPQLEERQTLSVASPYFGGSEKGLVRLKASLKAKRVAVYPAVHRDDGVDLNVMQKNSLEGFEFHRMKVEGDRFAHLKLISATGVQGKDWIFSGSINCTDAALSAENIEAGLWRPLDKKTSQAYFEKDQAPLPSKRTELATVNSDSVSGSIHFSAVFNGSSLKLYPAITQNPVKDVSITVSTSSREFNAHFDRAFEDQGSLNLGLNSFGKPLHFSGSAVVSVSAKSNDGNHVEGKALVDDSTVI
ncbi:MAG: hypothetical protein U1E10_01650 [Bdellovibrionales bacterium]|nr:hypothetical protein [Bdellovibrionales bacterium]